MKLDKYDIITLEHILTLVKDDLDTTDKYLVEDAKAIIAFLSEEVKRRMERFKE